MIWQNLLARSCTTENQHRTHTNPRPRKLTVETLERRDLLAASTWIYPAADGHLVARPDSEGDRIPDFSDVGYQGGTAALPAVPNRVVISPQSGDDGAAIQAAIDQVARMPLDENGIRGAVLLTAGEYQVEGQIFVWASGVVLRGEGDGLDGTIIRATGKFPTSVIMVWGQNDRTVVDGTEHRIVDKYVPVGARSFTVDSTAGLDVGDTVSIARPSTAAWIKAIGMNKLKNPWQPGSKDLQFDRIITRIEGNTITIDSPLTNSLDQKYGGGTIHEYAWPGRIENVGIEDLRGMSDFASRTDENHAWTFVQISQARDAWVSRVTAVHFSYATVWVFGTSSRVTVENCSYLDPISRVEGGRRYAFYLEGQLTLVKDCYSERARHSFVVGPQAAGPNVFVDSTAVGSSNDSGPHHRWSTGILFDNISDNFQINIRNRGNSGTGHGWTSANSVIWNSKSGGYIVESPPTAQNWIIGSVGKAVKNKMGVGSRPAGIKDSSGKPVQPRSLYYSQLQDQLAHFGSEDREYWIGDIDNFVRDGEVDNVFVDADWLAAIKANPKVKTQGFDQRSTNTWTAFTAQFGLDPDEQVISASLSLGVRATAAAKTVSANKVYIDSLEEPITVSKLGWGTISTSKVTGVVVDLTNFLHLLADGRLNVALADDLAVDWAVLNIQVAPTAGAGDLAAIQASADATVRGGSFAQTNFDALPALAVQGGTSANSQASLLAFDLTGIVGPVNHAVLRLPIQSAAAGLENGVAVVAGEWDEALVNWNTQPAAGKPFATWLPKSGDMVEIALTPIIERILAEGGTELSLKLSSTAGTGLANYGPRQIDPLAWQPELLLFG